MNQVFSVWDAMDMDADVIVIVSIPSWIRSFPSPRSGILSARNWSVSIPSWIRSFPSCVSVYTSPFKRSLNPFVNQVFSVWKRITAKSFVNSVRSQSLRESGLFRQKTWSRPIGFWQPSLNPFVNQVFSVVVYLQGHPGWIKKTSQSLRESGLFRPTISILAFHWKSRKSQSLRESGLFRPAHWNNFKRDDWFLSQSLRESGLFRL